MKKHRILIMVLVDLILIAIPIIVNALTSFGSTFSIIWLFSVIAVIFVLVRYQERHGYW